MIVDPTKVADKYNHKSPSTLEISAGAKERAGFIEAPEINNANPTTSRIGLAKLFIMNSWQ